MRISHHFTDREKDWLNRPLGRDYVDFFCIPFDENKMAAHPVSKLITSKTENTNVPQVIQPYHWPELNQFF